MKRMLFASIAIGALSVVAMAQTAGDQALPKGFKTTQLVKSGMTASNLKIAYPAGGDAEITAVIGELEAGGRTARHQHPVPVVVYVL
jgi:quercetin dioxygenase-like cupin family protein